MSPYETCQSKAELQWLVELFKKQQVRSLLEIGSRFGGSLWSLAKALPQGARVVSVDLPLDPIAAASLVSCIGELRDCGYNATLIAGDSRDPNIVRKVRVLAPFDALFIDADHSIEGVTSDWTLYGPMASMVAFHDIGWVHPDDFNKKRIDVPALWHVLKRRYRSMEMIERPPKYGIGVVWQ